MVPLITHSHYSLMRGTDSPAAICRVARRMGYERLALTDTDNLYGLWKFLLACKEEELVPIVGAEISDPRTGHRAVCLVKNPTGYANLCQLITRRHRNPEFALSAELPQMAEGLLTLTARADLLAAWHRAGVHTVAALPDRPLSPFHPLMQTARRLKIPLAATPNSFFLEPRGFAVHQLLRAIAGNTTLSRLAPGDTAPDTAWLASPEKYRRRFAICPQAVANTHRLADELTFTGPDSGLIMAPLERPMRPQCRRMPAPGGLHQRPQALRRRTGRVRGEPAGARTDHDCRDELLGLFSGGQGNRIEKPAHLRAGIGGGLPGGLLPGHHQCLPGEAQPLLRPFSQPWTHGPAGYRRGFCLGRTGRGHRRRPAAFRQPGGHGRQPHPVSTAHGPAGNRQGVRHARCGNRRDLPAAALVLAPGGNWMQDCWPTCNSARKPATWISPSPGRRSWTWPSASSAFRATSPCIPAGW